jgi:hypothetical protein
MDMEDKEVSFRSKRLLMTIPTTGEHSFKKIVKHYVEFYPIATRRNQVIKWIVLKAVEAMLRQELSLLRQAELIRRKPRVRLVGDDPTDKGRYQYCVTPKGVKFLNAK